MKTTDGLKLASSAAALLLASAGFSASTQADGVADPVKISQCEGISPDGSIVSFSSGHAMSPRASAISLVVLRLARSLPLRRRQ